MLYKSISGIIAPGRADIAEAMFSFAGFLFRIEVFT